MGMEVMMSISEIAVSSSPVDDYDSYHYSNAWKTRMPCSCLMIELPVYAASIGVFGYPLSAFLRQMIHLYLLDFGPFTDPEFSMFIVLLQFC